MIFIGLINVMHDGLLWPFFGLISDLCVCAIIVGSNAKGPKLGIMYFCGVEWFLFFSCFQDCLVVLRVYGLRVY